MVSGAGGGAGSLLLRRVAVLSVSCCVLRAVPVRGWLVTLLAVPLSVACVVGLAVPLPGCGGWLRVGLLCVACAWLLPLPWLGWP